MLLERLVKFKEDSMGPRKKVMLALMVSLLRHRREWRLWLSLVDLLESNSASFNLVFQWISKFEKKTQNHMFDLSEYCRILSNLFLHFTSYFLSEILSEKKLVFLENIHNFIFNCSDEEYQKIISTNFNQSKFEKNLKFLTSVSNKKTKKLQKKISLLSDNHKFLKSKSITMDKLKILVDLLNFEEIIRTNQIPLETMKFFLEDLKTYQDFLGKVGLKLIPEELIFDKEESVPDKSKEKPPKALGDLLEAIPGLEFLGMTQENEFIWEMFEGKMSKILKKQKNKLLDSKSNRMVLLMDSVHLRIGSILLQWMSLNDQVPLSLARRLKPCIQALLSNVSKVHMLSRSILAFLDSLDRATPWFQKILSPDAATDESDLSKSDLGFLLINLCLATGREELVIALGDLICSGDLSGQPIFKEFEIDLSSKKSFRKDYFSKMKHLVSELSNSTEQFQKQTPSFEKPEKKETMHLLTSLFSKGYKGLKRKVEDGLLGGVESFDDCPSFLFTHLRRNMQLQIKPQFEQKSKQVSEDSSKSDQTKSFLSIFICSLRIRFLNSQFSSSKLVLKSKTLKRVQGYFQENVEDPDTVSITNIKRTVKFDLIFRISRNFPDQSEEELLSNLCPEVLNSTKTGINMVADSELSESFRSIQESLLSKKMDPKALHKSILKTHDFPSLSIAIKNLAHEKMMNGNRKFKYLARNVQSLSSEFESEEAPNLQKLFLERIEDTRFVKKLPAALNFAMTNVLACAIGLGDKSPFGVMLTLFFQMNPENKMRCAFFCNFQNTIGIQTINTGENQITKWYKCRKCFTPFGVGNCGKTVAEKPCAKCGILVGGTHHKTNSNTVVLKKEELEKVTELARKRYHVHRLIKAVNQRFSNWDPEVFRFWHCALHLFYLGLLHYKFFTEEKLKNLILYKDREALEIADEAQNEEKEILKGGLAEYLKGHILCDLDIMGQMTGHSVDTHRFFGVLLLDIIHRVHKSKVTVGDKKGSPGSVDQEEAFNSFGHRHGKYIREQFKSAKRLVFKAKKLVYSHNEMDFFPGSARDWAQGRVNLADVRNTSHVFLLLNLRRTKKVSIPEFRNGLSLQPSRRWLGFFVDNLVGCFGVF